MMSEYYDKETLINVMKDHILEDEYDKINWDQVINDGEVYPHSIEGISGCFIYEIPPVSGDLYLVLFIHPLLPIEVFYDAWNRKYMYMDGTIGASVL